MPSSLSAPQLLPKTVAASERLARLRKQGAQLAALGMTEKVADNRKQQDTQAARIQVCGGFLCPRTAFGHNHTADRL